MKVLFVLYRYDYDRVWHRTKRANGSAYEQWYVPLEHMLKERGHTLIPFWIDEAVLKCGYGKVTASLEAALTKENPDIFILCGGEEHFDTAAFGRVRHASRAVWLYWCGDDSWRFDSVSYRLAPYFSAVVTGYSGAVPKYRSLGVPVVINSHFGVDSARCKKTNEAKNIDVSFVGTWNPQRGKIIDALRGAVIAVEAYGNGWPSGGLSQEGMVSVFSRSKISLSLNQKSFYISPRSLARLFFRRASLGEGGSRIKPDVLNFFSNLREWLQKKILFVKGRHFEIPACGTMQISEDGDVLTKRYLPDKEIIIYSGMDDLIKKVKYYLAHDDEREAIAQAGYERTMREHTFEKNMEDIFRAIGKPLERLVLYENALTA